jgi:hypothetical protein
VISLAHTAKNVLHRATQANHGLFCLGREIDKFALVTEGDPIASKVNRMGKEQCPNLQQCPVFQQHNARSDKQKGGKLHRANYDFL